MTTTNVVVTGYGATTPLGGDAASTWDALLAGRSGVSRLTADWVEKYDLPVRIAAQLAVEPTEVLKRVEANYADMEQNGMTLVPEVPEGFLGALNEAGREALDDWLAKTGDKGRAIIEAYTAKKGS